MIAIIIAVIGGSGLNVSFMVGLAFAVAASANFPALLLALTWRRFNTTGAITGVVVGVVSSIFLVIVSPKVWPGADTVTGSPIGWELSNPGIVSIPLGFLGCYLGTILQPEEAGRAHVPRALRALRDGPWRRARAGAGLLLSGRMIEKVATNGFPGSATGKPPVRSASGPSGHRLERDQVLVRRGVDLGEREAGLEGDLEPAADRPEGRTATGQLVVAVVVRHVGESAA